jgi:basic membrane lipoprotein Med (substrate-binding protein (PBP1-ABC) superfamily)
MWRAQLKPQQQAARKAGRSRWIGKAGPGKVITSTKKGVGYWSNDGIHRTIEGSGASWCYNWGVAPGGTTMKYIEFVPMIWDGINGPLLSFSLGGFSGLSSFFASVFSARAKASNAHVANPS